MSKFSRKSTLFTSIKNHPFDEDKVIEEVLTTPYEKVIKILNNVKIHLQQTNAKNILIKDLEWVLERISSHKLYTYEISDETKKFQQITNDSHEVKSFFEYLTNYSENKDLKGRSNNAKSKTERFKKDDITEELENNMKNDNLNFGGKSLFGKNLNVNVREKNLKKSHTVYFPQSLTIPIKEKDSTKDSTREHKVTNRMQDELENMENNQVDEKTNEFIDSDREFSSEGEKEENVIKNNVETLIIEPVEITSIQLSNDNIIEQVFSNNFNIFDFELYLGRDRVLIEGAKAIFTKLNVIKLISSEHLESFLTNVRDGYLRDTPYHNDLHGFDVCQTFTMFLYQTEIADHLALDELDILSIILSALMHDIGHPGYNNTFQMNSLSDMAITYNDKSVLENYHVSSGFKIMRKPECNILDKMNLNEFKHIRKRIIESILSTDMIFHAKIHSLVKNKLAINDIKYGANIEKIVDKQSVDLFEDQQNIINFLIHTADVSHNSKEFKLSSKWTELLMEEFWMQGDKEKSLGYPVSFLCDRSTAEVPKSQIGFIKSIIIPTFETLSDMLPKLNYYKENVYNNLDQWSEIVAKQNEEKEF